MGGFSVKPVFAVDWKQTQMFSVYSKNKGIGLTVPILLEGSVYAKFNFI